MKKLGKLSIKEEKVIKDNELLKVKGGGSMGDCCWCTTNGSANGPALIMSTYADCRNYCGFGGSVFGAC